MNYFILVLISLFSTQETLAGWCSPDSQPDCITLTSNPEMVDYMSGSSGPCIQFGDQDYRCIAQTGPKSYQWVLNCDITNPDCAEGSLNPDVTTEAPFQMPPAIQPTAVCGNLSEVTDGLTEAQKKELLDIHNLKRSEVAKGDVTGQPAGLDLIELKWDDDLALIAQNHVNNCTFKHDTYPDRETPNYEMVGQNLAIKWSTVKFSPNLTDRFMDWFNEEADFRNVSLVDSFESAYLNGKPIGHYTQVVWGKTEAIGCGFIKFYDESDPQSKKYKHMLACNYGPTGNYIGQPVYTRGTPVDNSDCPTNYPTRNTTTMLCY